MRLSALPRSGRPRSLARAASGLPLLAILTLACSNLSGLFAAQEAEPTFAEIPRASLADAKAAYVSGAAVFVDVRSAEFYDQGHIPGAPSIPVSEIDTE